jgi:hypothetical protein
MAPAFSPVTTASLRNAFIMRRGRLGDKSNREFFYRLNRRLSGARRFIARPLQRLYRGFLKNTAEPVLLDACWV